MTRVLFRVDAGPGVGLGHLQRCLSLASALRRRGAECLFITNSAALNAERIGVSGFEREVLRAGTSWGAEDLAQTRAAAGRREWTAVVVDSGCKGPDYLQGLRNAGLSVCAIEDLAPFPFPCQLVVNGDAHAERLRYESSSGDTRFLLGPEYVPLRQEFWEEPVRQARTAGARRILVTLGGADPHNLMPRLLRMIGELPVPLEITAVIGPYFERREEVKAAAESVSAPVRLVESPTSVRPFMEEADLSVSAAGQTLYELARVGCPTVSFVMGSDQAEQLEAIARAGCVLSAGDARQGDLCGRVREALTGLLNNGSRRSAMTEAGQRLVDGQGAHRVAEALMAMAEVPQGGLG